MTDTKATPAAKAAKATTTIFLVNPNGGVTEVDRPAKGSDAHERLTQRLTDNTLRIVTADKVNTSTVVIGHANGEPLKAVQHKLKDGVLDGLFPSVDFADADDES